MLTMKKRVYLYLYLYLCICICVFGTFDYLERSLNLIAGLVTLQGSAPRAMAVETAAVVVEMLEGQSATDVTGWCHSSY